MSHRDDPTAGQMLTVHAAEPGTRTHLMLGAEAAAMAMMDPLLADAQSEVQMTPPAQVYSSSSLTKVAAGMSGRWLEGWLEGLADVLKNDSTILPARFHLFAVEPC